jgi:hypothetical protein
MIILHRYSLKAVIILFLDAVLVSGPASTAHAVWETLVDGTSFNTVSAFQTKWNYNYPWGTDHNGSARMNQTNVAVSSGVVTLTSSLTNSYEGTSSAAPYLTIRYNSGTFYLKQQITISKQYPIWDISGQFKAPTQKGTWPAFWMTGANSWPPESDFMEFKGSTGCNQNTYNGSWQGKITMVSDANSVWHTYRLVATLENSTNVDFHYYIDGVMETEQTTTTFAGSPCWLIIDYQMEGSSGSPGPSSTTYFYMTNIVVKRENVSPIATGPVTNGVYKMLVRSTGDSLDVFNQNTATNSVLDQWPYNAGLNEQWMLTYLGSSQYCIIGRQSGRTLGVLNSSTTNGASVVIEDYAESNDQKWQFNAASDGYYELINVNSGKALEVSDNSSANAAAIDQWSAASTTQPQFNRISILGTNIVLTGSVGVPGIGCSALGSSDLTTPVSNWTPASTGMFDRSGNCSFTNGMALNIPQQFFRLQLQSANGAGNQKWSFQSP